MAEISQTAIDQLRESFEGDIRNDETARTIYSTDASVYQVPPAFVALPRTVNDIQRLIRFARQNKVGLIPRAAGTSLAGQVVGDGIVVDISRYMNRIVEIDPDQQTVSVQPGVIRDELNLTLAEHGLFFGPETSTSNRATIGGMLGNNSCGSNSITYGTTRHKRSLRTVNANWRTGFVSGGPETENG